MKRKLVISSIGLVVAGLLVLGSVWVTGLLGSDIPNLELTKDEALKAMNLQYTVVMATGDRDDYVRGLYAKYGLKPETHSLNVASGTFVVVEKKVESDAKK